MNYKFTTCATGIHSPAHGQQARVRAAPARRDGGRRVGAPAWGAAEPVQRPLLAAGYLERETFDAFLQLSVSQRKLISETIRLFKKANTADAMVAPVASSRPTGAAAQAAQAAAG